MKRDGHVLLQPESVTMPATVGDVMLSPSQKGRAAISAAQCSPRNAKDSLQLKMKFHFFSFQIADKTGYQGFL